jgi:hypothetical protein
MGQHSALITYHAATVGHQSRNRLSVGVRKPSGNPKTLSTRMAAGGEQFRRALTLPLAI